MSRDSKKVGNTKKGATERGSALFRLQPFEGEYDVEIAKLWQEQLPDLPARGIPLLSLMDVLGGMSSVLHHRVFKPYGHNFSEYAVLSMLFFNQGPLTPSNFMRNLAKSSAAIAQTLNRLERDGLISRLENPDDRRSSLICLTDVGKARAQLLCEREAQLSDEVMSALDDEALQETRDTLNRLIHALIPKFEQDLGDPGL